MIPVPAGQSLPDLPPSGIDPSTKAADLRGASMIDHGLITPGPNPSEYVFLKTDLQRNLFRYRCIESGGWSSRPGTIPG